MNEVREGRNSVTAIYRIGSQQRSQSLGKCVVLRVKDLAKGKVVESDEIAIDVGFSGFHHSLL
ncbi:MAG TPA: hypothetical protein DGG94_16540 [Micromonosporaceae bacterium]|nr:hypothetical protein [Micromonosporaceae bacterium]